uniref:RNB domain-containing protein n=1 Tax=Stomoxys calcitrans TaxID=35570 RepID=A0A1I8QAM4_STOCA
MEGNDDKKSLQGQQPPQTATKDNTISDSKNRKESKKFALQRISKKSADVSKKLQNRRLALEKREEEVRRSGEATSTNDRRAKTMLKVINRRMQVISHNGDVSSTHKNNEVPVSANVLPGSRKNGMVVAPKQQYSKEQLECLVDGLLELINRLTFNDNNMLERVNQLASNIRNLKDYSLVWTLNDSTPSTSHQVRNEACHSRRDSERYDEPCSYAVDNKGAAANRTSTKTKETKPKKEKKESSPQETLLKYINAIISEYYEDRQQNAKETPKIACALENLDDLESFSKLLVSAGLGRIVEKEIRINRKNNRQAFIAITEDREGLERDGIITLPVARRYAFDGDIVRAFVLHSSTSSNQAQGSELLTRKPRNASNASTSSKIVGGKENSICLADDEDPFDEGDLSQDTDLEDENLDMVDGTAYVSENCPKAFVISIVKHTELREVVGSIAFKNPTTLNSKTYFKLKPHDMKFPMVYIPTETCEEHIKAASKDDIVGMLCLAHILETDINGHCIGELLQPVGKVGNLEAEIKAILLHNGLKDLKPYDQKFYDLYDGPVPPITEEDLKQREDLRKKCIFTIDPLTARDLDDAVSVEKLSEDEYEIGVHISDVAHYLEENSELDNLVKERATSIYLVNEVIHMLPTSLCFRCSLLPGEDKFAFSVFWRWNAKQKEMCEPRFTRSVINSCSQFAYEHAQKILDNPEENFSRDDFPEIHNNFTPDDIKWRVLLLHSIAQELKGQRYSAGALSINNPKIRFSLDPVTGEPTAFEVEGRKEANFLIEEFMLLANQAVAKFIHQRFPNTSILRHHPPPLQKSMRALKDRLANLGLDFDISNSKSVYESMKRLCSQVSEPESVEACLNSLLTKPMARARYYCSEGRSSEADFWHYALSIPIYTHFTSPIRRYPDILVHRTLAASLNYCPPSKRTIDELHQLAKICNEQKNNAKNAGDESTDLFFVRYIKAKESITLRAVVVDIFQHMMNVVTIDTGHNFTITYKMQKVIIDTSNAPSHILISEKKSQMSPIKLQLFSTVDVRIVIRNNKTCAFLVSPDKSQRRQNCKESSKIRDKTSQSNITASNGDRTNSTSEPEEVDKENNSNKKGAIPKKTKKSNKKPQVVYALRPDTP